MAAAANPERWIIEPLARGHDRKHFGCSEPALDEFIRRHARQQQTKNVGRTFVAIEPPQERVLGFYTLAAASVAFEDLPADVSRRLPRYPVPAARIGRLAVDRSMRGRGLGAALLRDALLRIAQVSETDLGIVAVIVDAKNEEAKHFYESCGFVALLDHPCTLLMFTETILSAVVGVFLAQRNEQRHTALGLFERQVKLRLLAAKDHGLARRS